MNKYNNIKTIIHGIKFDSKKEGARFLELKQLERIGEIYALETQPRFDFKINGFLLCYDKEDFKYTTLNGDEIVEDVKGMKTAMYRLKKKMMKAFHGIEIYET
jgi:hypothetical protein